MPALIENQILLQIMTPLRGAFDSISPTADSEGTVLRIDPALVIM